MPREQVLRSTGLEVQWRADPPDGRFGPKMLLMRVAQGRVSLLKSVRVFDRN